jgi:thiaminase/transcriptional activator TenA
MSFSDELRRNAKDAWNALETHPFVAQMANGTLPLNSFRFYIDQNLLYLPEYARALAIGVSGSVNDAELLWFTKAVDNIVHVEIPENEMLREKVSALGGASHLHARTMAPATLAYTSYLLATAARTDSLGVMALILPCAWTYQDIAIANRENSVDHPVYSEWLRFFSTDDYDAVVRSLRADMDSLAKGISDERKQEVSQIFTNGVRLEQAFWDMAINEEHWPDLSK